MAGGNDGTEEAAVKLRCVTPGFGFSRRKARKAGRHGALVSHSEDRGTIAPRSPYPISSGPTDREARGAGFMFARLRHDLLACRLGKAKLRLDGMTPRSPLTSHQLECDVLRGAVAMDPQAQISWAFVQIASNFSARIEARVIRPR